MASNDSDTSSHAHAPVHYLPFRNSEEEDLEDPWENDSTRGSDRPDDTTSFRSEELKSVVENGRVYCALRGCDAILPTDDTELDRLDFAHALFRHVHIYNEIDALHFAPVGPNPQSIKDLGTGTGIWTLDAADRYPSAHVVGNDISPSQPWSVTPNAEFEIDDVERDWPSETFDYIHCRCLVGIQDWGRLVQQAYDKLNPGGWFECAGVDFNDYTFGQSPNPYYSQWANLIDSYFRCREIEPQPYDQIRTRMLEVGFRDVRTFICTMPLGERTVNRKDLKLRMIGAINLLQFKQGLEGFSTRPLSRQEWTDDEIRVLCANVMAEIMSASSQIQHHYIIFCGQKPIPER